MFEKLIPDKRKTDPMGKDKTKLGVKDMKMTIKKFEKMLYEKHGQLEKAEHFENGWKDGGPVVTKLWLYYANDKHVGTYNRKSKVANFIDNSTEETNSRQKKN